MEGGDPNPDKDEEFKKICNQRRMNGYMLIALSVCSLFISQLIARKAESAEEAMGAYMVPAFIFFLGLWNMFTNPYVKK